MNNILLSNQPLNVPVSGIVEFEIYGFADGTKFNDSLKRANDTMHDLYNQCLKVDLLWHFLLEGSWNVLRVSEYSKEAVERFFGINNITYKFKGDWGVDNQKATAQFQTVFTYLFHGFSVLAMEQNLREQHVQSITDRVMHCFCLSNVYNIIPSFCNADTLTRNWEAFFMGFVMADRAFYEGTRYSYEQIAIMNKENKNIEEKESGK